MTEQLPPHSATDEAHALDCIFTHPEPQSVLDQLRLDHFYDQRHRAIFQLIQSLPEESQCDRVAVATEMVRLKATVSCGGLEYIEAIHNDTHSPHNFPAWLENLEGYAIRRHALSDAAQLSLLAQDLTQTPDAIQQAAERLALSHASKRKANESIFARPVGDFQLPPPDDPTELIKTRYLCERGGMLITGPTGVGKSSFNMQALALWSNALPFFGLTPTRALTSVLIQAENDDGDIAEMRNGVATGLEFNQQQREMFFRRVMVHTSTGITGQQFCKEVVAPLLDLHNPNLLVIDPALSFFGGDVKEQKDVGNFLRQHLNPVIYSHNCACIICHHTNKPKAGKDDNAPQNGDWAYQGSGSAEWANWARAIISLQSSGTPGVYKLHAGKRGARIGWRDDQEQVLFEKVITHSKEKGVICWSEGDNGDLPDRGRKKGYTDKELAGLLGDSGMTTEEWQKASRSELGISESTFHRARRDLLKLDLVLKSKINHKWVQVGKST